MKTYTRPWDTARVVERAVGDRRDGEPHEWHGPSLPDLDDWARDQQFDYFVPDIINGMSFSRGRDGKQVEYRLEGGGRSVEQAVAEAVARDDLFNGRDRYPRVDDAVRDWMEDVWHDITMHGRAIHEIASLLLASPPNAAEPLAERFHGFALLRVNPREVGRRWGRWGRFVHHTSEVDQRERGLPRHVRLTDDRFAVFTLSGELGQTVREAVSGLRGRGVGSVLTVAPWSHPELYALGYTLSDHSAARDAVIARATRETGWFGRGQFSEHITGHYLVRRTIRQGRFTTRLRSEMLAHLNRILARQADRLGARVEIVVDNAFGVADYDEAERRLDSGKCTFREAQSVIGG